MVNKTGEIEASLEVQPIQTRGSMNFRMSTFRNSFGVLPKDIAQKIVSERDSP